MSGPTGGKVTLALALAILMTAPKPSSGTEIPAACGADPRQRCTDFHPGQVTRVYLAPGAPTIIELPPFETIFSITVSDQQVMTGKFVEAQMKGPDGNPIRDPNLQVEVIGDAAHPTNFFTVKALREMVPQPISVVAQVDMGGKLSFRSHIFEIVTRAGALTEDVPNTYFRIEVVDKPGEVAAAAAARKAAWLALHANDPPKPVLTRQDRLDADQGKRAADRLEQAGMAPAIRNDRYQGSGTAEDRAALAPSAMWDDGERTYLRYPGNKAVPVAWQILPGGGEALIGQTVTPDAGAQGSLMVVEGVVPMLRLRAGDSVLCIVNQGFDPVGRNPGTGTIDPGVRRVSRPPR
jgi:type IV secretion system protein VirB9